MAKKEKTLFASLDGKGRKKPNVEPFKCEDARWLDMVGDLLAQSARDYLFVCRRLQDLELERKLGYYKLEISWQKKVDKAWDKYKGEYAEFEKALDAFYAEREEADKKRAEMKKDLMKEKYSPRSITVIMNRNLPLPKKPKAPKIERVPKPKGMITPYYYTQKAALETERQEIRMFFLGDSYKLMSTFPGNEVLNRLDERMVGYEPKARDLSKIKKIKGDEDCVYQD